MAFQKERELTKTTITIKSRAEAPKEKELDNKKGKGENENRKKTDMINDPGELKKSKSKSSEGLKERSNNVPIETIMDSIRGEKRKEKSKRTVDLYARMQNESAQKKQRVDRADQLIDLLTKLSEEKKINEELPYLLNIIKK